MHAPAQARSVRLTAAVVFLGLVTVSCGNGDHTKPKSSESQTTAAHSYTAAYDAGWREGKRLFEVGGKGAAIREVIWGGCVRGSLTAQPRDVVDDDRGAWVQGCKQGVRSGSVRHPPAKPVTRRESDPDLLNRFRSWADAHGEQQPARHASQVVLIHLDKRDYDVELATTYTGKSAKAKAQRLASAFVTWWDGDDGDETAWNLIVNAQDGKRLTVQAL
ncbi:hypothetical protein [Streptomyces sp. NPDC096032]|uniref:hypothetical protein n=1 Tax=Streptomyces sp. NPDC096032 TaxID=3366070 RepID=UPI0037FB9E39